MTRYRILLVTAFARPWNNGWFYKAGFEKNGHTVVPFDSKESEDSSDAVLRTVKEFNPDFIIHTKDELPVETFRKLKRYAKVIMWYPDPVIPEWLPQYAGNADIFFTMSEGLLNEFRKMNPKSFWLTQAFEPSLFTIKAISAGDVDFFSSEVTFVGNLGSKPQYLSRRKSLERVIDEGYSFKWWGPKMPRKLLNLPLIFGKLGRSYGGRFVWGEDYAKVSKLSKVFLAFDSQPHIRKSMSARMYTAVGCGAFYMCRHIDGIEEVLEPGKEIVTFDSDQKMMEMIKYYLNNEEARKKIAEAGKERILRDHTYEVRTRQMLEIINDAI